MPSPWSTQIVVEHRCSSNKKILSQVFSHDGTKSSSSECVLRVPISSHNHRMFLVHNSKLGQKTYSTMRVSWSPPSVLSSSGKRCSYRFTDTVECKSLQTLKTNYRRQTVYHSSKTFIVMGFTKVSLLSQVTKKRQSDINEKGKRPKWTKMISMQRFAFAFMNVM